MKRLNLTRAEMYDLTCPMSGAHFRLQFWDCNQEDRHGKRRMAVAIFQADPKFPTCFRLVLKTRHFYPSIRYSCDGPDAAKAACSFLPFDDDILVDELEVTETDRHAEGTWTR
jgi:hypothetical protein